MLKIESFYPFQSFLRVIQEFHEDKAIVKLKSLKFEREFDFAYNDVDEISDEHLINFNQVNFGTGFLAFITCTLILFRDTIYTYPTLLQIARLLFVCGLFVLATGYKKSRQILLTDKKGIVLTTIKQTTKNANLISRITGLITSKVENIRETTVNDPFPDEKPVFELEDYDIEEFGKHLKFFYDDRLVIFYIALLKEFAYSVPYKRLNGKVFRGRVSAVRWFSYFCNLLYFGIIVWGTVVVFNLKIGINILTLFYLYFALFLATWLLGFVKQEVIGLYDKDANIAIAANVNRKNKDKVEKIMEYVISRIPNENKPSLNEDQL